MQTNKAEEDANRSTAANPVPLLYGQHSGAAMVTNARRFPFQQQQVANSPVPNAPPANNEPGRVSPAHPAHNLAAFLDEGVRPSKFDLLLQMDRPSQKEMEKHSWNPDDRSLNIFVKDDDRLTLHRHPVAQSTDCIRGRVGYSRGFHVWQIVWPLRQRGTHAVIGVATKQAALHAPGYSSLVGSNGDSYGWDLSEFFPLFFYFYSFVCSPQRVFARRQEHQPVDVPRALARRRAVRGPREALLHSRHGRGLPGLRHGS